MEWRGMGDKGEIMNFLIEVDEKQLQVISVACDVYARLQCGHLSVALDHCKNAKGSSFVIPWDAIMTIEAIAKPFMNLELNAHYGIGKFDTADISWDIHQVARKCLHDLKHKESEIYSYSTHGHEPMKFGSSTLAKITIREDD